MQSNVVPVSSSVISPVPSASAPGDHRQSQGQRGQDDGRYRLVIEEGPIAGSFIYKTLDRLTGEVIRQLPREEVVRLMGDVSAPSGSVFDTVA